MKVFSGLLLLPSAWFFLCMNVNFQFQVHIQFHEVIIPQHYSTEDSVWVWQDCTQIYNMESTEGCWIPVGYHDTKGLNLGKFCLFMVKEMQCEPGLPWDETGRYIVKASQISAANLFLYFCGIEQNCIYVIFSPVQYVYFTSDYCFNATISHQFLHLHYYIFILLSSISYFQKSICIFITVIFYYIQ